MNTFLILANLYEYSTILFNGLNDNQLMNETKRLTVKS